MTLTIENMNASEAHACLIACQQSVVLFYHALDRSDFPSAMAQISPNCLWERGGVLLRGARQIEDSLRKRSATQVARHIVNNFALVRQEAQSATAIYTLGLHLYDDGSPPVLPVPGSLPFLLVDVTCELKLEPDHGWRIEKLDIQRTFSYSREVIHPLATPKQD
ncbi:hypothetical protein [Cupriavidus sp. BIS7]|uniref:hypothetical protein n=1 Tax=Cupriavidus sp. BIS7 TaxID=1217718 RepID=UPI000365291E|nr:hypothetical protein [Cupriavidus sp. BIS7]